MQGVLVYQSGQRQLVPGHDRVSARDRKRLSVRYHEQPVHSQGRSVRCHKRLEEGREVKGRFAEKLCLQANTAPVRCPGSLFRPQCFGATVLQVEGRKGPVALFGFSSIRGHGRENGDR
jgi:hypothetical protein